MKLLNIGNRVVNSYIYRIQDGYVLIDTGFEHSFLRFLKKLKSNGIQPNDISYIFLTHAHDDHAGFLNQLIQVSSNVKIIVHPKALAGLYRGQNSFKGGCPSNLALKSCLFMGLIGRGEHYFPPFNPKLNNRLIVLSDENWNDVEQVLDGKIYETPGHTIDSISLLYKDGTLFCGDAAMNGFPSMKKIPIWVENKCEFISSWKLIISLKPSIILPAHGRAFEYKKLIKNMKYAEKMYLRPLIPVKKKCKY